MARNHDFRRLAVVGLVLFAGFCFWMSLSHDSADSLTASVVADVTHDPQSTAAIQTQAIDTIRVGQRVLAHNPEVERTERLAWGPEPDFSQWLHLTLEMPKEDGSTLTIQMLRPDEWVDSQLGAGKGRESFS